TDRDLEGAGPEMPVVRGQPVGMENRDEVPGPGAVSTRGPVRFPIMGALHRAGRGGNDGDAGILGPEAPQQNVGPPVPAVELGAAGVVPPALVDIRAIEDTLLRHADDRRLESSGTGHGFG